RNESGVRRERRDISKRAGLGEQGRERFAGRRRGRTCQVIDLNTDAGPFAKIKLVVLVQGELGKNGVMRAGVGSGCGRHDAEQSFARGSGGFVEGPDFFLHIVTEDIAAAKVGGEFGSMVDIPSNDRLAFTMSIIEYRPFIDPDIRRSEVALETLDD